MKQFNRPQVPLALQMMLGIKGDLSLQLEESVGADMIVANLEASPYSELSRPVGRDRSQAAVAAENSYCWVSPGPNVILQVTHVLISNEQAANRVFFLRMLTAANIVTIGATANEQLVDLSSKVAGSFRGSFTDRGSVAGLLGTGLAWVNILAGDSKLVALPSNVFLYGNDEGGVPGLGVACQTVNEALRVSFWGREWPIPG